MELCELCGIKEARVISNVEGSDLNVCINCSKFGKIKKRPSKIIPKEKAKTKLNKPVLVDELIKKYGNLIKKAREKKGLTQAQLAKIISEKESFIHNIEREKFKPNMKFLKKLEKILNIKLIEQIEEECEKKEKVIKSGKLTIGDLIKFKFKK